MKKYKISEVAKMFDITRSKLIHYDNWGILSPSIRNEKNYRFYTTEDIKKLELIIAFKESGLSLEEIKAYLINQGNNSSLDLLNRQKKELDKKIKTLEKQRLVITKRIERLSKFKDLEIYEGFLLEDYPEIWVTYEPIGFGPLMTYSSAVNKLKTLLELEGHLTSKFGICYDLTHKDPSDKYVLKYVFDYLGEKKDLGHQIKIPSGNFLRCIHKGKKDTIDETIQKIIEYAGTQGYQITGEAFYIPLYDYWESMSDEFLGEVLLPIKIQS
jgi:DNA-binding transcriptional MerR regulator/effector-binding domain-containing protein